MQSEERTKNIETFLLNEFYSVYTYRGNKIDIIDDYNFKNEHNFSLGFKLSYPVYSVYRK